MKELPNYINTAGKITVITSLLGVLVFAAVFLLNIGARELSHVEAQGLATTSVTVLNTPPQWTIDAEEQFESSTTTPTNSGSQVSWTATATDSNGEDYYLLICSNGNAPTASSTATPTCGAGAIEWAVSALASSTVQAVAATTTTEAFAEENDWFAWVCDNVSINPRCNVSPRQGSGTTASPFYVNHRPKFTGFWDTSNAISSVPGTTITFHATSSDDDEIDQDDLVKLIVCSTNSFNTTTDTCNAVTLATSTFTLSNPTATYLIPIPTQDQDYNAFGFIIDNHGHESADVAQASDSTLTVANAAPTVSAGQISLNGGLNMILTQPASQTTGFTLQFIAADNNSCQNSDEEPEIEDFVLSVYRSGVGTTTCDGTSGSYNPNNCYPSGVATSTWNLSCTPSLASCTFGDDGIDTTMEYNCTFPLWYIADPTDGVDGTDTYYFAEDWRAAVQAIDDNGASSALTQSSAAEIEVESFMSLTLDTFAIPYGQLEPGDQTDPLMASTTIRATGNVGLDELLSGESMCTYYTSAVTCNTNATSTIYESYQVFATSTVSYADATSTGNTLSSTTQKLLDLNVLKSTSTSSPAVGVTYWGIHIPLSLTLAGAYTGENTIMMALSDPSQWVLP